MVLVSSLSQWFILGLLSAVVVLDASTLVVLTGMPGALSMSGSVSISLVSQALSGRRYGSLKRYGGFVLRWADIVLS